MRTIHPNYSKWIVFIVTGLCIVVVYKYNYSGNNVSRPPDKSSITQDGIGQLTPAAIPKKQLNPQKVEGKIPRKDAIWVDNPDIDIDLSPFPRHKDVDLRILVITYNRAKSLTRLLTSLNGADYMNERVAIEVWIDRSTKNIIDAETYLAASKFKFDKGSISVFNHTRHVGLYGQWMGTWQPTMETKEMGVIMEDDLTVSPLFYRYLKKVHGKYDGRKNVNGFAMQVSMKHGGAKGNLRAPDDNIVFLYPVLGSWGLSPRIENWVNFINWYKKVSKDGYFRPYVPGILPTNWYKGFIRGRGTHTMWTMWHIYWGYKNREWTLYPNMPKECGFTINWKEKGLHFAKTHTVTKPDPLVLEWDARLDNLPDDPIKLDANGIVVTDEEKMFGVVP